MVRIYYSSDETVQEDEEIQAFVHDVCFSGMKNCPKSCGEYRINLLKCKYVYICANMHV